MTWEYVHERQNDLIAKDGWMCETHPGLAWPHGDCPGPGMPWVIEGRAAIEKALALRAIRERTDESRD